MDALERELTLNSIAHCQFVLNDKFYHAINACTAALNEHRQRLDALAAALGFEWVPEGKTPARWRKKEAKK